MRSIASIAALPRGKDLRGLYTDELRDLVNRHGLCARSTDRDRWAIKQPTAREARRACVGCPLNGVDGACFELAVRLDTARQRKARRVPVTERSKVTLDQVVYGGQTPGVRARVVKDRLLAAQPA
jgi:hypothetical protein